MQVGKHGGGSGGGEKVEGLLCVGLDLQLCLSFRPSLKEVLGVETKSRLSSLGFTGRYRRLLLDESKMTQFTVNQRSSS